MKSFKNIALKSIFAASLAVSATQASADGFYIGAGIYSPEIEYASISDSDTTPAFFVGYQFIDTNIFMFSAELGYYDLGSIRKHGEKIESNALSLSAVAYLPIGPIFEVYAKAGVSQTKVDYSFGGSTTDLGGTDGFGGIGASLDILDTIDIYVEYLVFDTQVKTESIGVGVRFDF
jgi:opacity protein-like surface antigen